MSRATTVPASAESLEQGASSARAGPHARGASTAPATPSTPPSLGSAPRAVVRKVLEGTPGRMRVLGLVAALAAAVFGLVGASALWSSAGALERADHNTAQVVRIQGIYADLVRADADATSAFLVGGLENASQRADYDASMSRVASEIAAAAEAQPADGTALGALNAKVQTYAATVEQARVYNRQGLPVGAQYLSNASATLRSQILPIVDALVTANKDRADGEFAASSAAVGLVLAGLGVLAVLVLVMVWLARRTHRYLNPSIGAGTVLVAAALVVGIVTLGGVGSQVKVVQTSDFADTVALADARSAAYDAKSNESLTLIARGSGAAYEAAWQAQSAKVLTELARLDPATMSALQQQWRGYVTAHEAIRALDNGGQWEQAVAAAAKTDPASATGLFTAFDQQASVSLGTYRANTERALLAPVHWVTVLGWLLLAICVAAALLVVRGMGQRLEEYR